MRCLIISTLVFTIQSLAWANQPPVAVATANKSSVTIGEQVCFDGNQSYDPEAGPLTYRWYMGTFPYGSPFSYEVAPCYSAFLTPGVYTVYLRVADQQGLFAVNSINITVTAAPNHPPIANAGGPYFLNLGDMLRLDGSGSIDPDAEAGDYIVSYEWDINNDGIFTDATGVAPRLSFVDWLRLFPGGTIELLESSHIVRLRVTDTAGAANVALSTLVVYDNHPIACFTANPNPVECNIPVSFDASCSTPARPDVPIVVYSWKFRAGDGNTTTTTDPVVTHAYASAGNYQVTLMVTDAMARTNTMIRDITVTEPANQPPEANAGPDQNVYTGDTAILHGSATSPEGIRIAEWHWSMATAPEGSYWFFGTPDQPTAILRVLNPGDYVVSLAVVDANGNFSAPDYVTVHAHDNLPPVAVATTNKTTVTVGEQVCFDGNQSYDPEGGPLTYDWNLGDGTTVSTSMICHTYQQAGQYNVTFVAIDERNAADVENLTITVNRPNLPPESIPTATPSFGVAPLTVHFAANASDPNEDPLTYFWDFGDPFSADNNSSLENPAHIYDQNGLYHVALDVCDGIATTHRSITIRVGRQGVDYLLGDIDFDGDVDFNDVKEFASAYLAETGDPDYNSDADLNPNDGFIDLWDFALLANDWGKTLP